MPTHTPLDTSAKTAAADADYAGPAISIDANQLTTPAEYPVRTAAFRERDYGACLPGDLAAAVDALDGAKLGPGRSTSAGLTGRSRSRRAQARQNDPDDDTYLGPVEARKESVRAALALLVDETAAHVVEAVAPVEREPWLKPGKRTPGHSVATQPILAYVVARDRVLSPSRSGTPRELPNAWPRSVTAVDWWTKTLRPAVDALPGLAVTNYGQVRDRPAITFTDAYEQCVRQGVIEAADADAKLASALGFDDDPDAARAAIRGHAAADDADTDTDQYADHDAEHPA